MEKNTQQMIICYRPVIIFKEQKSVIKHIAECIANQVKYFAIFGEFRIREEEDKKANNCECLFNRCVLGLGFSELADHKKQMLERVFENMEEEIKENGRKLENLNEQKEQVQAQIEIITNYQIS